MKLLLHLITYMSRLVIIPMLPYQIGLIHDYCRMSKNISLEAQLVNDHRLANK